MPHRRRRCHEVLQQGRMAAAISASLRGEPAVEGGVAIDLQAVEKLAVEQRRHPPSRSGISAAMPSWVARAISIASTKQSAMSSLTASPRASTLRRPGSSRMLLSLLRHQRSSPRGSLGTSHSSSQSWLRDTGCGATDRYAISARTLRDAGSASGVPSRQIVKAPSNCTSSEVLPRVPARRSLSTGVSTLLTTFVSTGGRYGCNRRQRRAAGARPRLWPARTRGRSPQH